MAKYVVTDSYKPSYEKNYKFPLINIVPAIVWSIPIHQKLFPEASWWMTAGLCLAFVAIYVALTRDRRPESFLRQKEFIH